MSETPKPPDPGDISRRLALPRYEMQDLWIYPPHVVGDFLGHTPEAKVLLELTWNGFVELLRQSYGDACRMHERLSEREAETWDAVQQRPEDEREVWAALQAISKQVKSAGSQAVVKDHPPDLAAENEQGGAFERGGWAFYERSPDLRGAMAPHYRYFVPPAQRMSNESGLTRHEVGLAYLSDTWGGVLDRAREVHGRLDERTEEALSFYSVLKFRRAVLGNVIWQYENFGWMHTWKEYEAVRIAHLYAQAHLASSVEPEPMGRLERHGNDRFGHLKSKIREIYTALKMANPGIQSGERLRSMVLEKLQDEGIEPLPSMGTVYAYVRDI